MPIGYLLSLISSPRCAKEKYHARDNCGSLNPLLAAWVCIVIHTGRVHSPALGHRDRDHSHTRSSRTKGPINKVTGGCYEKNTEIDLVKTGDLADRIGKARDELYKIHIMYRAQLANLLTQEQRTKVEHFMTERRQMMRDRFQDIKGKSGPQGRKE